MLRPRKLRADQMYQLSLEDWATGRCFVTVGQGVFRKEVTDFELLPQDPNSPNLERFARITVWSHQVQKEYEDIVSAWDEFEIGWLDCFWVHIPVKGME